MTTEREAAGGGDDSRAAQAAGPRAETRAPRLHLLNATLAGLPELEHFPSEAARQAALQRMGLEVGRRSFSDLLKGIVAVAGTGAMVVIVARLGVRGLSWPRWVVDGLALVAALAVAWGVLRFLHRRGFQRELRGKLIENGVAICRGCGYLLRGLAASVRCPECGRGFDADVRAILDRGPACATGMQSAAAGATDERAG